jgi:two-component system, OmpR family, sensor histidine kinase ResE
VNIRNSIVGKLWATIIGLVALVLLVNSLFMGQFIDNNLANSKDQELSLLNTAGHFAEMLPSHLNEPEYLKAANEILTAQDAVMILLDDQGKRVDTFIATEPIGPAWRQLAVTEMFQSEQMSAVLAGETVSSVFIMEEPVLQRFIAVAVPLKIQGKLDGAVILYQKQFSLEYTQAYFERLFIYAIIVGFLLTTFFAFFLSHKITKPLLRIKEAADRITEGDYHSKVPVASSDELGELAKAFNHMTGRLDNTITALNHQKEHLASILRSMADAVMTFDAEGRVIQSNPPAEKVIRDWASIHWEESAELQAQSDKAGLDRSDVRLPEPLKPLFDDIVSGATRELTSKLHVHKGVWSAVMAPLYAEGQVRGAVAVLRDVTEEFKLDKLRKDFVANVSHELRTPLSMLRGYSEALLDDIAGSPEERQELVQVIHDESLRMMRLVSDLLDLARMEAGHLELVFKEVQLRTLLTRVHRKFSVLCKERGISLQMELSDSPLVLHKADEDRLEQVFTNLLDNAARHTPEGRSITIRAKESNERNGKAIVLQIADTGKGIPAEDVPFIFERFYKADKARTRGASGGTGLGLAIVKNIIDAHEGSVNVTSQLGEGTTFTMTLPVSEADS